MNNNYKLDLQKKLESFLTYNEKFNNTDPIVCITSGGTKVPLEKNTIRYIDNFSRGDRGALSAESFIAEGYIVIFIYRIGTSMPFTTSIRDNISNYIDNKLLDSLDISNDQVYFNNNNNSSIVNELKCYKRIKQSNRLLLIPFENIDEYLLILQIFSERLNEYKSKTLMYLAAAVSDFYIPDNQMAIHKIQSSEGALSLTLQPVPKMLKELKSNWIKDSYVISFKLETDNDILIKKSRQAIEKYNVNMVIANELHTRKDIVHIVTSDNIIPIKRLNSERYIESALIPFIAQTHFDYHKRLSNSNGNQWESKSNNLSKYVSNHLISSRSTKLNKKVSLYNNIFTFSVILAVALIVIYLINTSSY